MKRFAAQYLNSKSYLILQHKLFVKEFKKIPPEKRTRFKNIILLIQDNAVILPPNKTSLTGYPHIFRTRVGIYRLIYSVDHDSREVKQLGVGSRGTVYHLMDRLM